MAEQWSSNEVVVQCWDSLTGIHVAKSHERGVVIRVQDKGLPVITLICLEGLVQYSNSAHLRNMIIVVIFLSIVVHKNATHSDVG